MRLRSAFPKEELRAQLQSFGATWMRWRPQRCDWCRAELTQDDVEGFVDWCMELGKLLPPTHRLPAPRLFCVECAGGAISEIIDGIRFSPTTRPSEMPDDPWSRPRRGAHEAERERYP